MEHALATIKHSILAGVTNHTFLPFFAAHFITTRRHFILHDDVRDPSQRTEINPPFILADTVIKPASIPQ